MRRLRTVSIETALIFTLTAGWTILSLHTPDAWSDDAPPAAPGKKSTPAAPPPANSVPPKAPAAAPRSNKPAKRDNTMLRAQRAQARRAEIALDDQYGPGAASFASSLAAAGRLSAASGSGSVTGPFSTSALGGSMGFGGFPAFGNFAGPGFSSGSTAIGTAGSAGAGSGSTGNNKTGNITSSGTSPAGSPSNTTSTEAPDLNTKVLQFARQNLGKQVGNGECWTLAAEALAYAGAQPPQGYVFGDEVSLSQALPGDILQFYSVRLVAPTYWMMIGAPHHTAIIETISGTQINMLNQNVNGVMRVQSAVIDLADQVSGTVTVYRPTARTGSGP